MQTQIGKKEIFCYGIGDFACNGFFVIISSFLMYFYTDVAGIGLAAVGTVITISRIIDAVSCLGMGGLIDRTNTRWGQARPYLLILVVPLSLFLIGSFYSPNASQTLKIVYALVTSSIFSILYSGLSVSYSTMMTCMTQDSKARLHFNLTKNMSANFGAFFVTSATLFLVEKFGGENSAKGFLLTMCFYSVLYIVIMIVCFANTCERVKAAQETLSFSESLKTALKNRHWVLLCVIDFLMLIVTTMRNQGTLYYAKYCFGSEALGSLLLSISSFLPIVMTLVVTYLAAKIGKKRCIIYGYIAMFIGILGTWIAGKNLPVLLAFHVIASIGVGIASGMVFVMIAEVVDYSEYQTGKRPQGFMTSVVSLMMKLGVAAAGFISALILELGNYQAGAEQSKRALTAIEVNYLWIPALIILVSLVVMKFYTLDEEYGTVLAVLEERKKNHE